MDSLISIGELAPQFELADIDGSSYSLNNMRGSIVMINFWSAECTWCERVDHELMIYQAAWRDQVKVWWVAANANEPGEFIRQVSVQRNLHPVLLDMQRLVADMYGAQTTPHIFIVDKKGLLAYQGAWDDITFKQRKASRVYVPQVIDSLLKDQNPEVAQTQPYGCVLVRFS